MQPGVLCAALCVCIVFCAGCRKEDNTFIPGLSWQMSSANPVLEPSDEPTTDLCGWYNEAVWYPAVVKDGTTFKMWFTGTNTDNEDGIGYATSSNGESWTIHQTPVFEAAPAPGSWDCGGVWHHCVLKDTADFKMFYTGYGAAPGVDDRIGLAYSVDGLVWTREAANPVVSAGAAGTWYEKAVYSGTVVTTGGTYMMWFSGVSASGVIRTGCTASSDCITWGTPSLVLDAGPKVYDMYGALLPSVVFDGADYHMYYTGLGPNGSACCYATSKDGIHWVKHGVARRADMPGKWEDGGFVSACVLRDASTLRMWYAAISSEDGRARIGYGTSPLPKAP
jgi:predicted GH43/DUF377 family glycosyl hydrolase